DKRAKDAEASALTAIANEKKAREKEELEKRARAEVEETLARSLLRPIGHNEIADVNDIELEAIWELAESRSDRVRMLFVERALERSETAKQLRNRAALAMHAAMGLDRSRQQRAEEVLLARLRDERVDALMRGDLALVGIALGDPSPEFARVVGRALADAMTKTSEPVVLGFLAGGLGALSDRLSAEDARVAARALTDALAKTSNINTIGPLAQGLIAVSDRLSRSDTAIGRLAQGLGAVSGRLSAEDAAQYAGAAAR